MASSALKLCEDMIDANENVTLNELLEAIGNKFPQNVVDMVKDQIDDLLIKKGTSEGLIQKALKITAMNPKIQYLKLKRQLSKEFGSAMFNKCKSRVKKILNRQVSVSQNRSDSICPPGLPASDGSLLHRDDSSLRKTAMRRSSAAAFTMTPRNLTPSPEEGPPGIKQSMNVEMKKRHKKGLKRAVSANIHLASLKCRERRNFGMGFIPETPTPSPYAVPSRAAPELHRTVSIESNDGGSENMKIADAVELVFLVRLKDVLVKNRGGLSSVQDYNIELMKAMQWLNTNVLDVARKDKGEAPASMCAVPNEGKLGLDIVLLGAKEMITPQYRTWKRSTDRASRAHFYYNRKTRRSTWTSPTAARTDKWTEHVHVDGGVVYEDDDGNTIEEKPVAFDGHARRPEDALHTTLSFYSISVTSFDEIESGDDQTSDVDLARIVIEKIRKRRRPPWAQKVPIKVIYLSVSESDLSSLRFSLKDINKDAGAAQVYISGAVVPFGRDQATYCRSLTRSLMSKPAPVAPRLIKWDLIDKDDNVRGVRSADNNNQAASIYSSSRQSGRYIQMPKPLGAGAFGTVYAAISDHGDTVAVKNIDKILMRKKKKESDVNHELGIQVWLSQSKKERAQYEGAHANISSLIEIFEEPHQMNIVVEIAENGSFFDLCKNKFAGGSPFTEEEARHYFRQILSGVNFCHKKGISHRDLKPENLLLGGPLGNTIKICDFGLANWVQESEKEIQRARSSVENDRSFGTSSSSGKSSSGFLGFLGRKSGDESEISHEQSHIDTTAFNAADARYLQTCGKGTMMYMAPEMWNKKKYDAFSTDIWAMGVILYLMLHGRYPFSINRLKTAIRAHRRGKMPMDAEKVYQIDINRNSLSPGAVDLLEKIMSLDMHKRISLTGIMNHPWMCKVSRKSIRAVLKDDTVFAVRRQGWLHYHGHGAFGRTVFKKRYVTVGGQEIRMFYKESRAKLKNFMRINSNTRIELDEKSSLMTISSPCLDEYRDIKMVDSLTFRCESAQGLKAWRSAIEVEISAAKNIGGFSERTRIALSSGLEESSEQLRHKVISYDQYLKMRSRMLSEDN